MANFDVSVFENVAEIDEVVKSLRERRKELKAAEVKADREAVKIAKAADLEMAKDNMSSLELEEGNDILFILKGEQTEGQFVKMTAARFIVLVEGEKKTLPFDKFIQLVE